eukprot:CAMPEP_0173389216 /NCGR_PEP_ID=MMETSP1356-20130122/11347_1 /TAXON_ID=77927 ORGANISM="Hemiselmis virescens, Strain PCC157" /NCGR_SAMPLE_ID=MMETSP1356 /ASSEMBLY_ACC=CAM_ASM_000847 /LENGTH=159 /DNA_ID=CAMNT_0014346313 /DNA_START=85 /DNA_END=564 /DNA_ORIENTATION=-
MTGGRDTMMRGVRIMAIAMVLGLFVLAGQAEGGGSDEQRGRTQQMASAEDGVVELKLGFTNQLTEKTVKMTKGGTLKLEMSSNPTTGYKWVLNGIEGSSVTKESSAYTAPPATGMVGGGGVDVWSFKADKAGSSKVILDYKRPWEDKPASQAAVTVEVE